MKRFLKAACLGIAPFLAAAMVIFACAAFQRYWELPPAEAYKDEGIHTFTAVSGYPTTRQGYYQKKYHRYSERRVYVVVYQAGSWRWEQDFLAEAAGKEAVQNREQVERRVLSLVGENRYITVEPGLTPQRYVETKQRQYLLVGGGCLAAAAAEGVVYLLLWRKKKTKAL